MVAAEIQLAQIKTINKKIQIYSQELEKIKNVKTASLVQEYLTAYSGWLIWRLR